MSKIFEFRKTLSTIESNPNSAFLNFAATCPLSQGSIESIQKAAAQMAEPLGQYFYQALNLVEQGRRELATLIGAHASELAFTQNTSTAISQIALAIPFKPGDRVIAPDNEFPSNFYVWQNLKSRGVELTPFHIEKNISVVDTISKMDLKNVKLLTISAVSFQSGRLHEMSELANFCRSHQILFCVDAIQAVGATPVDVRKWNVDFLAGGAQKWLLGPVGAGFIYVKKELLESLNVPFVGWTSCEYPEYFDLKDWKFSSEMTRFEPGLPNFLSLVGLYQSLRELKAVGWQNIFDQITNNVQYLQKGLNSLNCEFLTGETDQLAGILSYKFPKGFDHREVMSFLHDRKIRVSVRDDYIRVSPHFISNQSELDLFLEANSSLFKKPLQTNKWKPASVESQSTHAPILIVGASGSLGQLMAQKLAEAGHSLILTDQASEAFEKLNFKKAHNKQSIQKKILNLLDQKQIQNILTDVQKESGKLKGLIQCSGIESVDLFENLTSQKIDELIDTNFRSLTHIFHFFISKLAQKKSQGGLGILNILSSSGRCGYPLLSMYGATHGGLWTLGESLSRERVFTDVPVTNYIAPSMHSPMQKRMGRLSLRYFWAQGGFDYEFVENVADEALKAYLNGYTIKLSAPNRIKIFVNSFWPEMMEKKITQATHKK